MQADDTEAADQCKKTAAKRSKGSSKVSGSKQQAAAAAGSSKASKGKKAADTAAGADVSISKRQRGTGGSSKKGTKRLREEPANTEAATVSGRSSKKHKQQQQHQETAQPKQKKQKQQQQRKKNKTVQPKQKKQKQQQQDQDDGEEEIFVVDWILDTKVSLCSKHSCNRPNS